MVTRGTNPTNPATRNPQVDDPEATKPEDWDDAEDGDWEPSSITNPKCESAPGCGEWVRPEKPNPSYKGKWRAPMVDNPDYSGVWAAVRIPNPAYVKLDRPELEPVAAVGIEIWTMDVSGHRWWGPYQKRGVGMSGRQRSGGDVSE